VHRYERQPDTLRRRPALLPAVASAARQTPRYNGALSRIAALPTALNLDSPAPQSKPAAKKQKNRTPIWDPPNIDAPLRPSNPSPPCALPTVLQQSAARADALTTNLQNFTAQERIEFQTLGNMGDRGPARTSIFDYTVVFDQHPEGVAVRESRVPEPGSGAFPASSQDVGLPDMALIFLPEMQVGYEMTCEGASEWSGQPAWVVHF
jgi:hypothetical protein